METASLGKSLIVIGIALIVFGALFMLGGKFSWFGRLPGDIHIQKEGFSLFCPITTSIIISVIVSVVMIIMKRK